MTTSNNDHSQEADGLRRTMERAILPLDVPTQRLTDVARIRGKVVRRRQRLVSGLGVGVAASIVAGGAGLVLSEGGSDERQVAVATGEAQIGASTNKPATSPGQLDPWAMPVEEMATLVANELPSGVSMTNVATDRVDPAPGEENNPVTGYLHATIESANSGGPGEIEITLAPPTADEIGATSGPSAEKGNVSPTEIPTEAGTASGNPGGSFGARECSRIEATTCTTLTDESGVSYGVAYTAVSHGAEYNGAHVLTANGSTVIVMVSNDASGEKWTAPVTASAPPLTLDQVRALAESAIWTS